MVLDELQQVEQIVLRSAKRYFTANLWIII